MYPVSLRQVLVHNEGEGDEPESKHPIRRHHQKNMIKNLPRAVYKLSNTGFRTCKGETGMYAYYQYNEATGQGNWVLAPDLHMRGLPKTLPVQMHLV